MDYVAPPGTSLTENNRALLEVEALKSEKNKFSKEIGVLMGRLKGAMVAGSDDIAAIRSCALMPPDVHVGGFIFDVRSGELMVAE